MPKASPPPVERSTTHLAVEAGHLPRARAGRADEPAFRPRLFFHPASAMYWVRQRRLKQAAEPAPLIDQHRGTHTYTPGGGPCRCCRWRRRSCPTCSPCGSPPPNPLDNDNDDEGGRAIDGCGLSGHHNPREHAPEKRSMGFPSPPLAPFFVFIRYTSTTISWSWSK